MNRNVKQLELVINLVINWANYCVLRYFLLLSVSLL